MPTLIPLALIGVAGGLLWRFLPAVILWLGTAGAPEPPVRPPVSVEPPPGPSKPVEPDRPVEPAKPTVQPVSAELFVVIVTDRLRSTPQGLADIGSSSTASVALKALNASCVTVDSSVLSSSSWASAIQRVGAPCVLITVSQPNGSQSIVPGYPTKAVQDESGLIAAIQKIRAGG